MKLHHLALGARDVDRVARWYSEVFGLPELTRHFYDDGTLRSAWLDIGGTVLMVEHTDETRRVDGVGAGPFLLAFEVAADERDALESRLDRSGSQVEARTHYTSYARDPEGNRVAISGYPVER
jgi:catechol 2,3-dioxygenase-like lactoylglutathione lyase family enzyme